MKKLRPFILVVVLVLIAVPLLSAVAQDEEGCAMGPVAEDAPVVKIGAAVSDTGQYAREGGDTRNGYNLWLEWVNEEHGGINVGGVCHRAELIMYDDEGDSDTVTELVTRLIDEDEVDVILGPYSSGLTQVASVVTEQADIIMVEGNGASETLFERGFQNLFAVLTPAGDYTRSGIELAASLGAETAVVVWVDEPFSNSVAVGAQRWLEESGIEVLAFESYPAEVTDVTAMFTRFRDLDPDLIIGAGHFNDAVLFVNTAKELDFNPSAMLLTVGPSNPTFVEEVGADANYIWGASQWESTMGWEDPWFGTASDYAERYNERFGIHPSYQAAESSAAALVLHLAIEAAGSLETADIRQALSDMDIETFYGPVNFDETGKNTGKPMATVQVLDGSIDVIAPQEAAVSEVVWPAPSWSER